MKQDTPYDRMKYICSMMDQIEPGIKHGFDYKIKGTHIETLCKFYIPGVKGPYQRIRDWCESKTQNQDMIQAKKVMDECYELMKGRNESYGQSWKVLSIRSIANLIEMKMNRISELPEGAPKTEDELKDALNYIIFALIKLK